MSLDRISRPGLAALLVMGAIVGLATPASANHPVVSGRVACVGDQQVVTWTVENSESVSGTDRTMTVDEISVSPGTVSGVEAGDVLPPTPRAGSSRTATTVLPGDWTGRVTLAVLAHWSDGGLQDQVRRATVEVPGGCEPPPDPRARTEWDCSTGVVATLSNRGGGTVTFTVTRDGAPAGSVKVGAGAATARTYAMSEDDTDVFVVSAEGMDPLTTSVSFDCQQPVTVTDTPTTTTTAAPARRTIDPVVLGAVQLPAPASAPAAELPRTGSGAGLLAVAGFGLVAAGLPLAGLRRRGRASRR